MNKRIVLSLIALFFAVPALAGVVFEIETKDHSSPEPSSESMNVSIDSGNLKMEIAPGSKGSSGDMIFNGDRREMIVVDHDRKSYMVIDEEAMNSIGNQMSEVEAQMQQALKDVPADKRAMIEQMMKGRMPQQAAAPQRPSIEFRNTGKRDSKNGYDTTKYEMWVNGRKMQDLWVAKWNDIEGGEDAAEAFRNMAGLMSEMRDSLPSFAKNNDADNRMFENMMEIDGFPVVTYDYAADGSLDGETSLRSSKRQTLDPDAFEPPSGYVRQSMTGR